MEHSTNTLGRLKRECWCGDSRLESFSTDYLVCINCGTLVSQVRLHTEQPQIQDDAGDFYGREYWFSHQREELGLPDIEQRARLDLPERCLYWLQTLLVNKLPASRTLELGCSHGAFVSLLRHAGFDAIGLELSPWIVDYAQRTFGIPMLQGPIEDQQLPAQSFDAIILNDVLEHLPDPLGTLRHCVDLLKPDGMLLIQTPCYPEPKSYEQLLYEEHVFLRMLLPDEHIYLFSQRSISQLLAPLGWGTFSFKPVLFPYDMYVVVSQQPLPVSSPEDIVKMLSATPSSRMVLALLDKAHETAQLREQQQITEADRVARLAVIERQGVELARMPAIEADVAYLKDHLAASEAERVAIQQVIEAQQQHINEIEADRAARLVVIERQGAELGRILQLEANIARLDGVLNNLLAQWPVKALRRLNVLDIRPVGAGAAGAVVRRATVQTGAPQSAPSLTLNDGAELIFDNLQEYVATIDAFNQTRPDMNGVRNYSHQMIDILDSLCPVAKRHILDVGASPHGYTLEWALQKKVAGYVGIGLGVPETLDVRHHGAIGRLLNMNAEKLEFAPESFDLILSLSTFEHFFHGDKVLAEMYRVLRPGGSVLINFQPIWTCSYGHHLHHIERAAQLIPPWAHLLWNEETMRSKLQGAWPSDLPLSLDEAIEWIYRSSEINRIDIVTLRDMFQASEFEIEWITPLVDDSSGHKRAIAEYISTILPYRADDLMTLGYSMLLNKR